jgi:hypothetical protein
MKNDEIMEEEEKREREEREREEIFKAVRETVKILNTIRSTLESHIDEQAIVRGCIKKFYDVIRKKSAVNGKYLPWIDTSSPIGWDGDSEDSPRGVVWEEPGDQRGASGDHQQTWRKQCKHAPTI